MSDRGMEECRGRDMRGAGDAEGGPSEPPLTFGIYPGSGTGTGMTMFEGPGDDPERILEALSRLQPRGVPFVIRGYIQYIDSERAAFETPAGMTQYLCSDRKLDLVVCYRSRSGNMAEWTDFIRGIVRQYGDFLAFLQVGEEPNNPDVSTGGDGGSPNVIRAVIEGVLAAREEADRLGLDIRIGFNATPSFNPADPFWKGISSLGGNHFIEAVDYVGLDFFPDVFRPLPLLPDGSQVTLEQAVTSVINHFRKVNMTAASIPCPVPIHITENGWPTGHARTPGRQAEVIESVIRTVDRNRSALNITHYELFDLRDASSSITNQLQFGLLYDDYNPKPAFERYRQLISELAISQ